MTSPILLRKKKLSKRTFLSLAQEKFGQTFGYDKVVYRTSKDKLTLTCKTHGDFESTPERFLASKYGCPQCGNQAAGDKHALPFDKFLERATLTFPAGKFLYDQSSYTIYTKPMKIRCNTCMRDFTFRPADHLASESGCPFCCKYPLVEEYDYHKVAAARGFVWIGETIPDNVLTKTRWRCLTCAYVWDGHYSALQHGGGCPNCSGKAPVTTEEFIRRSKQFYEGREYDYSMAEYKGQKKKVIVICPQHGPWKTWPVGHMGGLAGCPGCWRSSGEIRIALVLEKYGIKFETEKSFPSCRHKNPLFFDFYLPGGDSGVGDILIEYQGEQHVRAVRTWGGEKAFELNKLRDQIKRDWCAAAGIHLIEIPYTAGDIEEFLRAALPASHLIYVPGTP